MKPIRYIGVHLDGNFAAPSLRFHHARQRDEARVGRTLLSD